MAEELGSAYAAQDGSRSTVLVVEDEGLIRLLIAEYLRDCGLHVLEAARGEDALALFAAGRRIDVVFSDVQMPSAHEGIALAHWIRKNRPRVHIMLTSGLAGLSDISAPICVRESTFSKPYECLAVAARIQTLLGSMRAAPRASVA